jgi:hypothetical protein
LSIVVVLGFVGIVGDAVVDGVPNTEGLEDHLHDQGPFRIVGLGQHRPRDVRGRPLDDALDDARSGVLVARVAAMGATTATWRRTRRLYLLLAGAITDLRLLGTWLRCHSDGENLALVPNDTNP